jgi:hypothetical protein
MIRVCRMLKKLVIGTAVGALLTAPAFAQVYYPATGTGNIINPSLAEATNGALGVGRSVYGPVPDASSAYAYVPRRRSARHRRAHRYYSR